MNEEQNELRSLFGVEAAMPPRPWRAIALGTAAFHVALLVFVSYVPLFEVRHFRTAAEITVARHVTPIFSPVLEPTQKAPNEKKLNRDFDVDSLKPRPNVQIPDGPVSTTRPDARVPAPVPVPAPVEQQKPLPEPPKVDAPVQAKGLTPPKAGMSDLPPMPPQIQTQEKPKLAFEPVGAGGFSSKPGTGTQQRIPVPSSSVSEAVRDVVRNRTGGGLVVGDSVGDGIGGLGEGLNLPPSPGRTGSNLELLSDPQGVDFRPYLIRVLAAVRRNWFAVLPESARMGNQRGRVLVQFAIDRKGSVPKLVISVPSGSQPLDRAAVAGISASNPFPPLPAEFKGEQIRLQFTFSYNMQPR